MKLKIAAKRYNERYQLIPPRLVTEESLQEFRYNNGLETAEECKHWIAERGISLNELSAFVERELLLKKLNDSLEVLDDFFPSESEIVPNVRIEMLLSGRVELFCEQFSQMACHYSIDIEQDAAKIMGIRIEREELDKFTLLLSIDGEPEERWYERAALFTALKNRCEHYCLKRVTRRALLDTIAEHQLDWTWVDYTVASFAERSGANEAVLALREGGESLIKLAREAELDVRRLAHLLDHEPEGITEVACQQLMSANCGEIVGPIEKEDRFLVLQLKRKEGPSVDHPDVKKRAEDMARLRALRKLIEERIEWSI